jgi:hypothetical protein
MDLRSALLSGKKLTHNSLLRKELYDLLKSYNFKTYSEAVYIYINELKEIPKCPFSEENQYFDRNRYVGFSKNYFNFIKHDTHVNAKWLSWERLFKMGLSLEKAKELKETKVLLWARTKFPFSKIDHNKIEEILVNDGFLPTKTKEILYEVNFQTLNDTLNFIEVVRSLYNAKNNTLQYYINRGYSEQLSKEYLHKFLNTWDKFKIIDKESERYKQWLESRKPGLQKVRKSLRSTFEKQIYNDLKTNYDITLNFNTPVNNPLFSKSKFKHDFLFNNKLIVEYNGAYWHKDMFSDKRFNNIDDYKLELLRAKISIQINNLKYLILWESDINGDIEVVKNLIHTALTSSGLFFSSREIDVELYNSL